MTSKGTSSPMHAWYTSTCAGNCYRPELHIKQSKDTAPCPANLDTSHTLVSFPVLWIMGMIMCCSVDYKEPQADTCRVCTADPWGDVAPSTAAPASTCSPGCGACSKHRSAYSHMQPWAWRLQQVYALLCSGSLLVLRVALLHAVLIKRRQGLLASGHALHHLWRAHLGQPRLRLKKVLGRGIAVCRAYSASHGQCCNDNCKDLVRRQGCVGKSPY